MENKNWTTIGFAFVMGILLGGLLTGHSGEVTNVNTNMVNTEQHSKTDLNHASLEEIEMLPGVGKTKAEDIIENRPYKSKGELLGKHIVGKETFRKIQEEVEVK